jgi:acetyltransferase-like isoleucine patch superfamily enzyme
MRLPVKSICRHFCFYLSYLLSCTRFGRIPARPWSFRVFGRLTLSPFARISSSAFIQVDDSASLVIGRGVHVGPYAQIIVPSGSHSVMGPGSSVMHFSILSGSFHIGSDVLISPRVTLLSGSHSYKSSLSTIRDQDVQYPVPDCPVSIGDDCWICTGNVVLPGSSISSGTIIGTPTPSPRVTHPYSVYSTLTNLSQKSTRS